MAKILIVDDELMCREMLAKVLRMSGYGAVTAANGQEALDAMGDHWPDLVILDLMMPRMDGWTFLSLARAHPLWRGVPVIVLTAVGDPARLAEALGAMGVRDCVVKGQVGGDALIALIARHLPPPTRPNDADAGHDAA